MGHSVEDSGAGKTKDILMAFSKKLTLNRICPQAQKDVSPWRLLCVWGAWFLETQPSRMQHGAVCLGLGRPRSPWPYNRNLWTFGAKLAVLHDGSFEPRGADTDVGNFMGHMIKINVDAGISIERNVGTVAAVCHNWDGTYLGSSMLIIQGRVDPPMLEAIACREALSLAQDLRMQHLQVASDCKQVVHHIHQGVGGDYGIIIKEILDTVSSFSSCVFSLESIDFLILRLIV